MRMEWKAELAQQWLLFELLSGKLILIHIIAVTYVSGFFLTSVGHKIVHQEEYLTIKVLL